MSQAESEVKNLKVGIDDNLICRWCEKKFINRGNLAVHAYHVHNDKSYLTTRDRFKCTVCNIGFVLKYQLKFHIRRLHFNLYARQPYSDLKKVNQVWFEKVLNSNAIVEMKKPQQNMLLIRKLDDNTSIKVRDNVTEVLDLHELYPTGRPQDAIKCKICSQKYNILDLKKHVEETHFNLVNRRCNNCNTKFKSPYNFIKHCCNKINRKLKVLKKNDIRIDHKMDDDT